MAAAPRSRTAGLWVGPISALVVLLCVNLDPKHPEVTRMAAVALWMAVWWVSEAMPLAVTALLPLVLFPLLGLMPAKALAPAYLDQVSFLFIGGFAAALAMERWGLHERFAVQTVALFGRTPKRLLLGFLLASAFISMWMSNTAATMVMMAPATAVIRKLEAEAGKPLRPLAVALLLACAYGASIGGIATLVGTPTNLVLVRLLHQFFPAAPPITFLRWMLVALPVALVMLAAAWGVLTFLFLRGLELPTDGAALGRDEVRRLGPATPEQKAVLVVCELMALLWLFRADIDFGSFRLLGWTSLPFLKEKLIDDSTVAMLAALALLLIPSRSEPGRALLTWSELERLPWGIVILFGGGFALAKGFDSSGLSAWCGQNLAHLGHLSPFALTTLICFSLVLITEFTANTSTVEMVIPVLAGVAMAIHVNPLFLMVPATICASLGFMMPAGTPPNAIVFATGRMQVWEMVRAGFLLNLVGAVTAAVAMLTWGRFALGFDLFVFPAWAVR